MFIDLGDHNHGSDAAYYFNRIYDYPDNTDHIYSRLANELGYDAIVVGNHDIEAGYSIFNKIKEELKIPYLGANVLDNSSSYPYLQPYTVIDKQDFMKAEYANNETKLQEDIKSMSFSARRFVTEKRKPTLTNPSLLVKER